MLSLQFTVTTYWTFTWGGKSNSSLKKMQFLIWTVFQCFMWKLCYIYPEFIVFVDWAYSRKKGAWVWFFKNVLENLSKFYEKCMKCENFIKKGSPLCVIITPNELLEWALIEVLIAFEIFKMDCHIIQKPLKGCYI